MIKSYWKKGSCKIWTRVSELRVQVASICITEPARIYGTPIMGELRLLVLFTVLTNFCFKRFFLRFFFRWPVSLWVTSVNCNPHHPKSIEKTFYRELNSGLWIPCSMCWPLHLRTYSDPKDAYFRWVAFAGGSFFSVCHDCRVLVIWFFPGFVSLIGFFLEQISQI